MDTTVLAIDDSPEVLAVLIARLRPEGFRVLTALDWQQGLDLAFSCGPDVVLLDVCLPEQSGFDLCRRLKADARTADVPVIFLTSKDDVDTKIHGFDVGAVDYVTKPFHPDELRARVRTAVRAKREREGLHREARTDGLTGLANRVSFDGALVDAVRDAERTGEPLSLVLLDLDHFKAINDDHGHVFGDRVLRRVGAFLREQVRRGDVPCRYGGEELAIILPNTPSEIAAAVAERLRQGMTAIDLTSGDTTVSITASFGVASLADVSAHGPAAAQALVGAADEALYAAKSDGRDSTKTWAGVRRRERDRTSTALRRTQDTTRKEDAR